MAWVYILRGSSGRHYIGSCVDLDTRFAQHLRGHTATTKRLGTKLAIVAKKRSSGIGRGAENRTSTETQKESRPRHLLFATVEQPRKLSGLVGSSNFPPGTLLNGLGLHSASVERLPLHWILHGSRRKIRSGSSWSYSNNRAPRSETCDCGKKEVAALEEARRMRTSTEMQKESSSPAISI